MDGTSESVLCVVLPQRRAAVGGLGLIVSITSGGWGFTDDDDDDEDFQLGSDESDDRDPKNISWIIG